MIRKSKRPQLLNWIYFGIEICIPIVVALYTSIPCIIGINHQHPDFTNKALFELLLSFLPPVLLLSIVFIPLNLLPIIRKKNKLSLRWSLGLFGLLSIPSVIIAGLSPLYAFMSAFGICFGMYMLAGFYGPTNLELFISVISIVIAIIISIRVYNEIRAT